MRRKSEMLGSSGKQIRKAIAIFLIMIAIALLYQIKSQTAEDVNTKIQQGESRDYRVNIGNEEFEMRIHPKNSKKKEFNIWKSKDETMQSEFERYIRNLESQREGEYFYLPKEYEGKQVNWKVKEDRTSLILLLLGFIMGGLVLGEPAAERRKQEAKRKEQLMLQYPQLVELVTILMGSGMSLRLVIKELVTHSQVGEGPLEQELQSVYGKLQAGMGMQMALTEFAESCDAQPYRKFVSVLLQNQSMGTSDLARVLELEARESEALRLSLIKEKAQKAETRVLIPITMLLLVVIVVLMVPAFLSLKG